jgi:hypothetical protein
MDQLLRFALNAFWAFYPLFVAMLFNSVLVIVIASSAVPLPCVR